MTSLSFKHKGLKRFYDDDDCSKLPTDMVSRIGTILNALDAAVGIEDMDQPSSFRLHQRKSDCNGQWAVTVRANWRIVFAFEASHAAEVDFTNYD